MTIECYFGTCKYHGTHSGDEGPYCFEEECKASDYEIQLHGRIRELEMADHRPTVAWRYRFVDPVEGPSTWQLTADIRDIRVIGDMAKYEIQQLKL